jgi:hypothetical protein
VVREKGGRVLDRVVEKKGKKGEEGAEHLRALAAVSRFLRSAERREQLRAAGSADEILALLVDAAAARAA